MPNNGSPDANISQVEDLSTLRHYGLDTSFSGIKIIFIENIEVFFATQIQIGIIIPFAKETL